MARRFEEEKADDDSRVIAYFDLDCFYAQAEVLRQPHLQDRPVGVTQKFLVVTCNYVARHLGVPKMAPIDEAKRRCPDLVLINGEDLTPYRAASKIIMQVLSRFGTLERHGLDEAALDITEEVRKRVLSSLNVNTFLGYLVGNVSEKASDILSSAEASPGGSEIAGKVQISQSRETLDNRCLSLDHTASTSSGVVCRQGDVLLMVGSHLVAEIRAAVEKETGYRCSSGIAHNKLLAKLACSLNKPNKQTCILPSAADNFLRPLSVRKIPGVGQRMEGTLKEMGIGIVEDMQRVSLQQLVGRFGRRVGKFLYNACRGIDLAPVINKGHAKSLSVEDSVRNCTSLHHAKDIIQSLAPDLLARLDEDKHETGRRPQVFSVKWRVQGNSNFSSLSTHMPLEVVSTALPFERREELVVQTGMQLLARRLQGTMFSLVVLNIGATKFSDGIGASGASCDIRSFLRSPLKSPLIAKKIPSKHEARLSREGHEKQTGKKSEMDLLCKRKKHCDLSNALSRIDASCFELEDESDCSTTGTDGDDIVADANGELSLGQLQQITQLRKPCHWLCSRPDDVLLQSTFPKHSEISNWKTGNLILPQDNQEYGLENRLQQSDMEVHKQGKLLLCDATDTFSSLSSAAIVDTCLQEDQLLASSSSFTNVPCDRCGKMLVSEQLRQEHADYHLALDLQKQENSAGKSSSELKVMRLKRGKNQRGSLDSFVYKLEKR